MRSRSFSATADSCSSVPSASAAERKGAIELGRDDDVAGLERGEESLPFGPISEGHRAGDAALDEELVDLPSLHHGVAVICWR
ncbi:hypothetical protein AYJ54_24250 [Bradyrhizobium centrolobii]|uniref:Uncharacterized protein n=2 Tax=Bradyrhizobium TaxID=374 RepID=A0A176YL31_9BRAD|nr:MULTISPECIES: hypothetical protein [Bradyrhizobium]OAF04303.1 hypothetical protein AYJ54_24250 [Bradyrhizobium centrolobii]OAF07703.1 hypothetical protein AXW67_29560 [Bradyrhizobium neotropicale]